MAYTPEQEAQARELLAKGDKLGTAASQQTGVAYTPVLQSPTPISATGLQTQQQPTNVAPFTPTPTPQPVKDIEAIIKEYSQPSPDVSAKSSALTDTLGRIEALYGEMGNQGVRKSELETQAGLPGLKQNLNQINAQINAINSSAFTATQNAENRQAPTFAIYGEQAQIERQKSAQTYGLAAASAAMTNNIALAQDNVRTALDAEFGQIESKLGWYKTVLENDRANLSAAEKKQADMLSLKLAEREQQKNELKEARSNIYNVMLKAAEMGSDPLTLRNIMTSKTPEEALQIASAAGVLVQNTFKTQNDANGNLVEFELNPQGRVVNSRVISNKVQTASNSPGSPGFSAIAPYGSDDYWTQLFAGSKGGKALTGEQITPLSKAAIVLNQVGELAEQIRNTDTDPLLGILRDNNPYDVKARLIQAQLRSTVPNLARGVYGEVGVLTDSDIANYIQTLPNIRTPQEANDLILGMTLRTIQNSFRSYLETYANSGRDVSGFVQQYESIGQKVAQLTALQSAPNQPFTPEETNDLEFQSGVTKPTSLFDKFRSWWNS
jgi:hypothetical protein